MTFVVMGIGTAMNAIVNRRDPGSGLDAPVVKALVIAAVPVMMLFLATQLPTLQQALLTTTLSTQQWLQCVLLAAALPIVVEISKAIRRRRSALRQGESPRPGEAPSRRIAQDGTVR